MTHFIFSKSGKPFLAIPVNAPLSISLASISCLPSFTFKRKLFKILLFAVVLALYYPLKLLWFKKNSNSDFIELENWCESFLKKLEKTNVYFVIIWSLVPNRERFYVHFIDNKGFFWFAKLTANPRDAKLLMNEANKIIDLNKVVRSNIYGTPEVIGYGDYNNLSYVVLNYLAKDERLFHPSKNQLPVTLLNSVRGDVRKKELQEVFHLGWWHEFDLVRNEYNKLSEFIAKSSIHSIVSLSNVHGDFGSENILLDSNGSFKVIDWERSHSEGPFFVDEVAFWLGRNHKEIKRNAQDVVSRFYSSFKEVPKIDLGLALCFLVGANFDLATVISKDWNKDNEDTFR